MNTNLKRNLINSVVYGVLFYVVVNLVFYFNFGNIDFRWIDLIFIIVPFINFFFAGFLSQKSDTKFKKYFVWVFFVLSVPVSYYGLIMGGLLGILGIILYGIVPVFLLTAIGFWIAKLLNFK